MRQVVLKPIHLAKFERFIRKWQNRIGLLNWEIFVGWGTSNKGENRASLTYSLAGRISTIYFARDWDRLPTNDELERIAFHELWHLVLANFRAECETHPNSSGNDDSKEAAMHEIIRIAENLVFGLDPQKGTK